MSLWVQWVVPRWGQGRPSGLHRRTRRPLPLVGCPSPGSGATRGAQPGSSARRRSLRASCTGVHGVSPWRLLSGAFTAWDGCVWMCQYAARVSVSVTPTVCLPTLSWLLYLWSGPSTYRVWDAGPSCLLRRMSSSGPAVSSSEATWEKRRAREETQAWGPVAGKGPRSCRAVNKHEVGEWPGKCVPTWGRVRSPEDPTSVNPARGGPEWRPGEGTCSDVPITLSGWWVTVKGGLCEGGDRWDCRQEMG